LAKELLIINAKEIKFMKNINRARRILMCTIVVSLFTFMLIANAHAGKIVLANDEWTLSNSGFLSPNDAGTFATNVAGWFNGGSPGSFLVYSSNFGLTQSSLSSTMTSAGNSWTVSMGISFDLPTLLGYDGIFLAGNAADNAVLINYVNAGGNVYLAGGTGAGGGAAAEAAQWNTFLNTFGLGFDTSYNHIIESTPINSLHPIFAGVDHLYHNNGNDALDIFVSDPLAAVLVSSNGHGLYAAYDSGTAAVPEPSAFLLLGSGLVGVGLILGFSRRKLRA